MNGVELIAAERERQLDVEKWDFKHDEDYKSGELIGAAACYAASAINKDRKTPHVRFQVRKSLGTDFFGFPIYSDEEWVDGWPWDEKYDKRLRHDAMRSLAIAGALIAAEIDRLQSLKTQ